MEPGYGMDRDNHLKMHNIKTYLIKRTEPLRVHRSRINRVDRSAQRDTPKTDQSSQTVNSALAQIVEDDPTTGTDWKPELPFRNVSSGAISTVSECLKNRAGKLEETHFSCRLQVRPNRRRRQPRGISKVAMPPPTLLLEMHHPFIIGTRIDASVRSRLRPPTRWTISSPKTSKSIPTSRCATSTCGNGR